MGYTVVALKDRILEMYPDIGRHGISMSVIFNEEIDSYDIKLKKDLHELTAHLDRKDADECMNGEKCVHLGIKIGEFLKNFK